MILLFPGNSSSIKHYDSIPLYFERMKLIVSEVFEIPHKISPSYTPGLVNEKVSYYNFRNKKQVEIPQVQHPIRTATRIQREKVRRDPADDQC